MTIISTWWNNLQNRKRSEWLAKCCQNKLENGKLRSLNWPANTIHDNKEDFVESDWLYKEGDRCERFVIWCFKYFTQRCTVKNRRPRYTPMNPGDGDVGSAYASHWVTYYDVLDDDGDWTYCPQADLSL